MKGFLTVLLGLAALSVTPSFGATAPAATPMLTGMYNAYGQLLYCYVYDSGDITITKTSNGITTTEKKTFTTTPDAMKALEAKLDTLLKAPYDCGGIGTDFTNPWGSIKAHGVNVMESGIGWWCQAQPGGSNLPIRDLLSTMQTICGFTM